MLLKKINQLMNHPMIAGLIFYGWNLFFILTLITVEYSGGLFSAMVYDIWTGWAPVNYLLFMAILYAIPPLCLYLGWRKLKGQPLLQLKWFYGFEVPLLFFTMLRLFGIQQLTWSVALWFTIIGIAIFGYAIGLIGKGNWAKKTSTFSSIFQVFIGASLAVFLTIYLVPLCWNIIALIIREFSWENIMDIFTAGFVALVVGFFFALTFSLLVLAPFALIWIYCAEGIQKLINALKVRSSQRIIALSSIAVLVILIYPKSHSHELAIQQAKEWKAGTITTAEILKNENKIREGLTDAYLYDFRYLAASEDYDGGVASIYKETFDIEPDWLVAIHNFIISPFVFQGAESDANLAANHYQDLFDQPIERAETDEIADATKNKINRREVEASIREITRKQVQVTDRDIDYSEVEPGLVKVNFHERYINKTYSQREVFYYFTLAENTVITNLWLSDTDSNLRKYPCKISPRGAAQQVYNELKRQRLDPALLEQVGPYQYRLRVFPVPSRQRSWGLSLYEKINQKEEERPMHITLELLAKADAEGQINLPELIEKRNVFWEPSELLNYEENEWFPAEHPQFKSNTKSSFQVDGYQAETIQLADLPKITNTEDLLVLVDGSYSMRNQISQIDNALEKLKEQSIEIRIATTDGVMPWPETPEQQQYLGNIDPFDPIRDIDAEVTGKTILWLTDKGSYELLQQDSARESVRFVNKVDIIHLDGFAPIYEDALMESVVMSGGGFYSDFKNWSNWKSAVIQTDKVSCRDGNLLWVFEKADSINSGGADAPLVASRLAQALASNADLSQLGELDTLHAMAKKYSFVSPISSMICLINDRQKKMLEDAENQDDRFEREIETGNSAQKVAVTGSPEPHEWMMIGLVFLLMLYLYRVRVNTFLNKMRR